MHDKTYTMYEEEKLRNIRLAIFAQFRLMASPLQGNFLFCLQADKVETREKVFTMIAHALKPDLPLRRRNKSA
jgi:hypothetical protein